MSVDASQPADVPVIAADAPPDVAPLPDTCPPGWVRLPDRNCAPPALACDPDAGTTDPTCLPGGLRSAALTPWACPMGWRQDAERGCLPTLRTDCPEGSGPLPDGTCTDTGLATCPDTPYAPIPSGADPSLVVYVDDDAPEGGDGSREHPLRDLSPVLERARAGTTVLLAAGRYPVGAEVRREVTVRGVCAPRVVLVPPEVVTMRELILAMEVDAQLTLEGISSRTVNQPLVNAINGARVTLRSVIGHAERDSFIGASDSTVNVENVVWSADVPERDRRWAVAYARAGDVQIHRASVSGVGAQVAYLYGGANATIEDVAAVRVEGGITADPRARVDAARVFVSGAHGHGIWHVESVGTYRDIALEDVSVREAWGASLTMERVSVLRGGLEIYGVNTSLSVRDLAMTDVAHRSDRVSACLTTEKAARVSVRRGRFTRCDGTAAYAVTGASFDLEDALFREVRPSTEGLLGIAVTQALGGSSSLRRVIIDHAGMAGIAAVHLSPSLARGLPWEMWVEPEVARAMREPARVEVHDVVIRNGESVPTMPSAAVFSGSYTEIEGERVAVFNQGGVGLLAGDTGFERQTIAESIASGGARVAPLLPPFIDGPSIMRLQDLYVGGITRARILWDNTTRRSQPDFVAAYGAYVATRSTLSLTNAYFDGGDTTENALVSQGALRVQGGLVTRTARCAAARNTTTAGTVTLYDVRVQGNARDEVCVDDAIPALRLPMSPN